MTLITLQRDSSAPTLTEQIVEQLINLIDRQALLAGTHLPSIRKFATELGVSTFTVVEAYDRLVALRYLQSRAGAGFYVASGRTASKKKVPSLPERAFDYIWLIRGQLDETPGKTNISTGKLPREWNNPDLMRRSLKALSVKTDSSLNSYGEPHGYAPLRRLLQIRLNEIGVQTDTEQIVLTQGATQALDFVIRLLLKPGDAVMVDDPGYFNLFGNLQLHGLTLLPVPRTPEGPDVQAIQDLQTLHRPKVFFTQSALHNPTGTSLSTPNAFRLLQLAEQYNFRIVENDSYMDLVSIPTNRLAALDQLNRVIFIGSFSKTVSASVRVGYLACHADLAEQIANIKMLTSITSAQLNEQLVHHVLTDGHYRRHMERLRSMLADAMRQTLGHLDKSGFEFFAQPVGGKFVWVRHPQFDDSSDISRLAAANDIILAPGSVFRPDLSPTAWLRFNVAQSLQPALHTFLKKTFR